MIHRLAKLIVNTMKKNIFVKAIIIYLIFISTSFSSQSNYFEEGIKLFNKEKFDDSKVFFERDIVFNPKSEKSYLYLAKIFKEDDNDIETEINLENVLLLNPKNDEALYMFAILKIKQSDYNKAKKLIDQFNLTCKTFCSKN